MYWSESFISGWWWDFSWMIYCIITKCSSAFWSSSKRSSDGFPRQFTVSFLRPWRSFASSSHLCDHALIWVFWHGILWIIVQKASSCNFELSFITSSRNEHSSRGSRSFSCNIFQSILSSDINSICSSFINPSKISSWYFNWPCSIWLWHLWHFFTSSSDNLV